MKILAFGLFAAVISCDTVVTPTQTVNTAGSGQGGATSISPTGAPTAIDSISIEVVDNGGCAEPSGIFHPGCVARVTATPRINGVAVSPQIHGPICTWFLDGALVSGSASNPTVYVTETANPFNLAVYGQSPGTFLLEAEVMTVRSGPKRFAVR
jgi:hypothetical protein